MDERDIYKPLTSKQVKDRKMCGRRLDQLTKELYALKEEDMTDKDTNNRDILMTYFVSYSGNKFIETTKLYYPLGYNAKVERLGKIVSYLSKTILKPGIQGFRRYAQLGWMYNQLPRTAEAYENCIRYYYFSVGSCRDVSLVKGKWCSTSYIKDFWEDINSIELKNIRAKDIDRSQIVYLELAKLVYLPFLYGYGWTVVMKTETHK